MDVHWLTKYRWVDHPANPLIEPPRPEWLLGDPTVFPPEKAPDDKWHMFANTLRGIFHFVSPNGINWGIKKSRVFPGMRAFLFYDRGYCLLYENISRPWRSYVALRRSADLLSWSEEKILLEPSLSWEGKRFRNCSCPCLVAHDGGYRLYYSGGAVFLPDCKFPEPKYIGVAEADNIEGPYRKLSEPILSPSATQPYFNMGRGAFRTYPDQERWFALTNGIFKDPEGHSRSTISMMESDDGLNWSSIGEGPIISPEPGWKRSLVYAMDLIRRDGEFWLYYNARDGWFRGSERIGLAVGRPI